MAKYYLAIPQTGNSLPTDGNFITLPANCRLVRDDSAVPNDIACAVADTHWGFLLGDPDTFTASAADVTAPTIDSTSPINGATDIAVDTVIDIVFTETVTLETGNIVLRDNDGGWADLETFNVATGSGGNGGTVALATTNVTNDTVRITPGADLDNSIEYAIRIDATAIDDGSGNSFAGIADDTTLSFTTAAVSSGLPTTGLKLRLESDNAGATATSWPDPISGITLTVQPSMVAPDLVAGGTPTGEDYYDFDINEGLGALSIGSSGLPAGASARTVFLVGRWPTGAGGDVRGFAYGNPATKQGFGLIADTTESSTPTVDLWGEDVNGTTNIIDNQWHILCGTLSGAGLISIYCNDMTTAEGSASPASVNTVLDRFYINEIMNNQAKTGLDVAAILIYDSALDQTTRVAVADWLDAKYLTP